MASYVVRSLHTTISVISICADGILLYVNWIVPNFQPPLPPPTHPSILYHNVHQRYFLMSKILNLRGQVVLIISYAVTRLDITS